MTLKPLSIRNGLYIVFCLIILGVFIFNNLVRSSSFLVISHNDSGANGGPLSILNLNNKKIIKPIIEGVGCSGVAQINSDLMVYCLGNNNNLWSIKLTDQNFKAIQLPKPKIEDKFGVPIHSKVIVGSDLTVYYHDGRPGDFGSQNMTSAGILIDDGKIPTKVFISDRTQPYFVFKMVLDELEQKLWVMSMGSGESVLIDRIDLVDKKVDFTSNIKSYSGFDMILNNTDLVVSVFRTEKQSDLYILDKYTGETKKEISLPVVNDVGYNALSLLVRNNNLFISSEGGLYIFDPHTYEEKDFIENNPGSQFTFLLNGDDEIFAIDSYNYVIRIPDRNPLYTELILEAKDQGLTNLYFINNNTKI